MNSEKINTLIEKYGLQKFRAKQLANAFFENGVSSYDEVSTLKKELREQLKEEPAMTVKLDRMFISGDKRAHKALLKLHDGRLIETVLMNPMPGHWTACISSQVGCALACTFCATGQMGLLRNLTSEEISDQVLFWRHYIHQSEMDIRLNNVVYMGMGEPFHNRKEVFKSLAELTNPETFGMGSRHISVSTSGLTQGIDELAEKFPQVNLALSLHSANEAVRDSIMPINRKFNLYKLADTLNNYIDKTNRKVFIEYILLEGENDSMESAEELARYLREIKKPHLMHVNLIVYNKTDSDHQQSSKMQAGRFKNHLLDNGISATIRKNLGRDIDGACGQLAVLHQK